MPPFWIQNLTIIKNEIIVYTESRYPYQLTHSSKHHTNAAYHGAPDMTAIDYPEQAQRFEVAYNPPSTQYHNRIRVKTLVDQVTSIPPPVSIYDGLN